METFLLLAMESASAAAEAEVEGGFGFNFDVLETNLINLTIVIALLFYFGRKFVGGILEKRKSDIEIAIREAEQRTQSSAAALADQQQKLAQAQQEAERIKAAAEESAKLAKEAILSQASQDVERMKAMASQELSTERDKVFSELRQRVVSLALQRVADQLPGCLDDAAQQRLVDRSIALLGG